MKAGYRALNWGVCGPLVNDRRDRFQGLSSRASGEVPRRFMTHSVTLRTLLAALRKAQRNGHQWNIGP
jgi:hypothetical protein